MTEAEWLTCTDPTRMLEFLRPAATQRQARLFLCACCRELFDADTPDWIGHAIEAAEEYAGGMIGKNTFERVGRDVEARCGRIDNPVFLLANWVFCPNAKEAAEALVRCRYPHERRSHPEFLRDIIGSPYRTMRTDPLWLASNDGAVPKLAQVIYDGRRFGDLPLLADALEEAGCTVADVLDHCRSGGEHVRGCWVVDLVLGKE